MRKEINEIIRSWAMKNGNCYEQAWNKLYREFNKQNKMYVKARARHAKVRPLDVIEKLGALAVLITIAKQMYA